MCDTNRIKLYEPLNKAILLNQQNCLDTPTKLK